MVKAIDWEKPLQYVNSDGQPSSAPVRYIGPDGDMFVICVNGGPYCAVRGDGTLSARWRIRNKPIVHTRYLVLYKWDGTDKPGTMLFVDEASARSLLGDSLIAIKKVEIEE